MDGRRSILIVVAVVLVAGSSAKVPAAADRTTVVGTTRTVVRTTVAPTLAPVVPQLRILLVGDQIMGAAGTIAKSELEATGRATVTVDTSTDSGLASATDWNARVQHDLDQAGASIVVAQFGGVDTAPFAIGSDGAAMVPGTGPWFDRWSHQQRALAEMLRARHVSTYWLDTPPAADPALDERVQVIDLLAQSLFRGFADSIAHIDVRDRLVGPDGHFAAVGQDAGRSLQLRTADGYGLAPDGARIVGDAIAQRLEEQWCLTGVPTCHVAFSSIPAIAASRPDARRVLLIGDSMMWQLAPELEARLGALGLDVRADVRSTTSLVGPFDWPGRIAGLVDTYRPDLVVGLFLGDLAPGYTDANGEPIDIDTQYHYDLLGAAINAATNRLRSHGAHVMWVAGPRAAQPAMEQRLEVLEALYQGVADRSVGAVSVLDGFGALSDASGDYMFSLPDAAGNPIAMRLPDGLHLSAAGVDRLAGAILDAARQDPCVAGPKGCARG